MIECDSDFLLVCCAWMPSCRLPRKPNYANSEKALHSRSLRPKLLPTSKPGNWGRRDSLHLSTAVCLSWVFMLMFSVLAIFPLLIFEKFTEASVNAFRAKGDQDGTGGEPILPASLFSTKAALYHVQEQLRSRCCFLLFSAFVYFRFSILFDVKTWCSFGREGGGWGLGGVFTVLYAGERHT